MMRKTGIVIALCCAFVLAQDSDNERAVPVQPTNSTSSEPPTTSTDAPSTTPAPPETSTSQKSTTLSPSTTEPPITTLPPPTKGHYLIKNGNNTCIIAEFAIQGMFSANNKTWDFDVPFNATVDKDASSCSNETQELALLWEDQGNNSLIFQFTKNETTKKFMVSQITLTVAQSNITLTEKEHLFPASVSKSYRCEKEQEVKLTEDKTNLTYAVLKISQLQLEAFHTSDKETFSTAEDCATSSTDVVPIAVGCALVGLIAIVLIAYLVGRRRSQARGYLSM